MGNMLDNFKWVVHLDSEYIVVYPYHNKAEQDQFFRSSFKEFNTDDGSSVILTAKQSVQHAKKFPTIKFKLKKVKNKDILINWLHKMDIGDTQIEI